MVEQTFVPFGRDGAIAKGQDRGTRSGSGAARSCWSGEPDVIERDWSDGRHSLWVRGRQGAGWREERVGAETRKDTHPPFQDVIHGVALM